MQLLFCHCCSIWPVVEPGASLVFYAELKQGNRGVRNVSCPAVRFPEERRPRTKSSCAEAVLCDMPKSRAAMVLLCAQRVPGIGKRKAQSLLLSLTKLSALNVC